MSVFEEIIVNSEYHFEYAGEPRTIVDAGANIGLTSVFFANRFPQARIFAIEPEASNFEMLKKNAGAYPNIVCIHAALWKESIPLDLTNPGTGNWGFQTKEHRADESTAGIVPGITLDQLMQSHGYDAIDVLKVDIEGAEKEVFEASASWIDRIGAIIIELHDRTKSGCSQSVYAAAKDFPIEWRKGETIFLCRPNSALCGPEVDTSAHKSTPDRHPTGPRDSSRSRIVSVQI